MRIKAVLRDKEILDLERKSKERVLATANKNIDRVVSQSSLLKVMGLESSERIQMLQILQETDLHIWLAKDAQQDIILLSKKDIPEELKSLGYQWQ